MEEKRMYHVKIKNEVKEYEAGITYHDIAKEYQKDYEHEIVLVFVDGKLQELHKRLKKDCEISFVTTADPIGHEAYKRSMSFLLVKAVYDVAGHKNIDKVRMHFAIGPGYYCTIPAKQESMMIFLSVSSRGCTNLWRQIYQSRKERFIQMRQSDFLDSMECMIKKNCSVTAVYPK